MSVKNEINTSSITEYIERYNWKGVGTHDNPILIEDNDDLPQYLLFKTGEKYIEIKDIDIGGIIFEKCQNIILEDSILSLVKLKSCKDIIIKDNLIRDIKIILGANISIENNRFHTFFNIRLFTIIMFMLASISALMFFLSYIEILYFLRESAFILLVVSAVLFFIDIKEKKNTIFLSKKYRNNEFVKLEKLSKIRK
ncbi:MAG: hypothetical protein EU532_01835 [Promethearchaeota archaeon]|nr:MAG: hypothetical protein EU532_01835 [Candidatus Lokiarchaeota archaeon]